MTTVPHHLQHDGQNYALQYVHSSEADAKADSSNLVLAVPVLKVVAGGHGPQVVRVPADDPRASLRIVFALDTARHVQYCQRLCIGQCRRLDYLDASATSLEVVL